MGLIKAALGAAGGVLADSWKEYFYCEALPENIMAVKGQKRVSSRSSNKHGSDNIITTGSVIAVADGQCMMIVEQGKIVELCAEPGEFTYDASTEPSIFTGHLSESIMATFAAIGKRFTFGGEAPKDQRVYYFNTKELIGNKYGTPNPVPFRVVDERAGIDVDVSVSCFGEYSYRICDPMLFYTNVCGNISDSYDRSKLDGQLKTELMTALQPAFARISELGIRYSALPGHTTELAAALNEELSASWKQKRGLEIVSVGVSSIKASEEDEKMIKEMQKEAAYMDPRRLATHAVNAQAEAMKMAASNPNAGPVMAFAGMNAAAGAGAGIDVNGLFNMAAQQEAQAAAAAQQAAAQAQSAAAQAAPAQGAAAGWTCTCGHAGNTGKFCVECGKPQPAAGDDFWICSCGTKNKGKFCMECGTPKPAGIPQYKCDKCGWEPADPTNPPKFCPECGDPFDDGDVIA